MSILDELIQSADLVTLGQIGDTTYYRLDAIVQRCDGHARVLCLAADWGQTLAAQLLDAQAVIACQQDQIERLAARPGPEAFERQISMLQGQLARLGEVSTAMSAELWALKQGPPAAPQYMRAPEHDTPENNLFAWRDIQAGPLLWVDVGIDPNVTADWAERLPQTNGQHA